MLTEAQVAKARTLPGCSDITADNAVDKLYAAATTLQKDTDELAGVQEANATLATRVKTLEGELATAKNAIPQQTPQPVLLAMASAARIQLKAAISAQSVSPAVSEALAKVLIGEGDALSAAGLTPGATGDCLATQVFAALSVNGAAPAVGKDAKAQAVPKVQHGAPDNADIAAEAVREAADWQKRQLAARGFATA